MTKKTPTVNTANRLVCQNKKAYHDYEIMEKLEAGIVLLGTEVKSLREGRANLKDSYAKITRGEVFLHGLHISPYSHASYDNHDPERVRKLLLHNTEIKRLVGKTQERGFSLIPLKIYFSQGRAKVELGLARGKKLYDKRESMKRKEETREMDRLRKQRRES
ncbi:SsrA-binding protein SmpB [Desulforhabdus sp. TSK]|uniref:SsrA-binding protein SmpB n=1 Tax=Desulforhabdus sp. TSK TaxID=2925014 RepID=UPI001FC85D83|nr:SsrA-binding protein SmpB [Desulforhabdus sp. TSK]GKT07246.1 SsrA-binding protein [Desulforhabdus sp. TSK]